MKMSGHFTRVLIALFAVLGCLPLVAQTLDTGSLRGRVLDRTGQPLPGAVIRARGPQGVKGAEADSQGNYAMPFLSPGSYEVTVTMDGYSTQVQTGVQVHAQQSTGQSFKLDTGTETVIVKAGVAIDTHNTTTTTNVNLTDVVQNFAQGRSLTAAFDFAPGAISGSGVGGGNYSIGGASGLENQYLVGGVNITNSGYGAIGAYDSVHGALGTGMTTEFLETLDIREGGFEAEYGGALGGVISATVKSGSNDFHGALFANYSPRSLNGANPALATTGGGFQQYSYDLLESGFSLGGPIVKDRLFFFVGYNPSWSKEYRMFRIDDSDLANAQVVAPFANREYDMGNNRTDNWVAHVTWNLNERNKLDLVAFGSPESNTGLIKNIGRSVDPTTDIGVPTNPPSGNGVYVTDPYQGSLGTRKIKDISLALKYFGTITPWLNIEAQVSYHRNQVVERPGAGADTIHYTDQRRLDIFNAQQANLSVTGLAAPTVIPSTFSFGGLGFYQAGSNDQNTDYQLKFNHTFSALGSHDLKWGGEYTLLKYRENIVNSGPSIQAYIAGRPGAVDPDSVGVIRTGVTVTIRCFNVRADQTSILGACPSDRTHTFYRVYRGNFNPPTPDTYNKELNLFLQDRWTIKRVTLDLGVRYTSEKVGNPSSYKLTSAQTGNPLVASNGSPVGSRSADCIARNDYSNSCYIAGPGVFVGTVYKFKGEFSPRIGLAWDVLGNGKSKLYTKFARLYERVPNDLAVRSFGNELGVTNIAFSSPDLTNQYPNYSNQIRRAFTTGTDPTIVQPGTRLPYKDDFVFGYQFEPAPRFQVDIRANYRRQGRVLEDTQTSTVEAIQNYYYNGLIASNQCINCAPGQTEVFPGAGRAQFGTYVLANVGENAPTTFTDLNTGLPVAVTFGKPESTYKAMSVTLTKQAAEGEHLSLQASYRISRLSGNYEGLFRNDNGQSDPNITSLFDFPDSPMLHSQYSNGLLNTDTPHSLKINTGYRDLFVKNLMGSLTFKWQSGQLRTPLLAHPVYGNSGEIPGLNPQYYLFDTNSDGYADRFVMHAYTPAVRGSQGRKPDVAIWDAKLGYDWILGKSSVNLSVIVFNLFGQHTVSLDQDVESSAGVLNPFYGTPNEINGGRTVQLGLRWSFY